jgi:hypothetical protein
MQIEFQSMENVDVSCNFCKANVSVGVAIIAFDKVVQFICKDCAEKIGKLSIEHSTVIVGEPDELPNETA